MIKHRALDIAPNPYQKTIDEVITLMNKELRLRGLPSGLRCPYFLRVSITGACNFKCFYCDPRGGFSADNDMSSPAWIRLLAAGSVLGITSIHWTGGEPTMRRDMNHLIDAARQLGYEDQAMTTNGAALFPRLLEYNNAGLNRINLSIDTLRAEKFESITGRPVNFFHSVQQSLEHAPSYFIPAKLNFIVSRTSFDEIEAVIEFAQNKGYILRLVELLNRGPAYQVGNLPVVSVSALSKGKSWSSEHVSKREIVEMLATLGTVTPDANVPGHNGHAEYCSVSGLKLPIGIVAPHSAHYACTRLKCHKIRVSPSGYGTHCTNWSSRGKDLQSEEFSKLVDDVATLIERKDRWRANPNEFPEVRLPDYDKFRFAR
jgi:GTP 3',8-cyclase